MRCKCCDAKKTRYAFGDYYCTKCVSSIRETIAEDRQVHDLTSWVEEERAKDNAGT